MRIDWSVTSAWARTARRAGLGEPDHDEAEVGRHLSDRELIRWPSQECDDDIEYQAEQGAHDRGPDQTAVVQVIREHGYPIRSTAAYRAW